MRRFVAVAAALAFCLVTPLPVAAGVLEYSDMNGNGVVDAWVIDDSGDGVADRIALDGNENGLADMQAYYDAAGRPTNVYYDADQNGYYETLAQIAYAANGAPLGKYLWNDSDQNGRWENGYWDGQFDNYYEWVCVDTNYDGVCDQWRQNTAPAGRTATDEIARRVAANNWVTNMHALGLSAFFPTVSVPLP